MEAKQNDKRENFGSGMSLPIRFHSLLTKQNYYARYFAQFSSSYFHCVEYPFERHLDAVDKQTLSLLSTQIGFIKFASGALLKLLSKSEIT